MRNPPATPTPHTTPQSGVATIRSLWLPVYLPTLLFGIGAGAVIPIVAIVAQDLGASVGAAALVVAARGLGTLAFDLPAGWMVARLGERTAMMIATVLLVVSLVGCVLATTPLALAAFMFLMGCGWAVWLLARLAYVAEVVPQYIRARALSVLGGVMRVGHFIGPFIAAVTIATIGLDGPYLAHIVLAVAGLGALLVVRDVSGHADVGREPVRFRAIGRDHAPVFMTAGFGVLCLTVLRACRPILLPLWAIQIGVDAAGVALIFGISAGIDMLLFYPSGIVSDRWGRKVVAIPCMAFLILGYALLPLTESFVGVLLVGIVMGFGNGLGSGIVMTLGTDFAPPVGRAEFLGVWRLVTDVGSSGGPLVAAAVAALAGLAASSLVVGAIGLAGVLMIVLRVPEPLHRPMSTTPLEPSS